MQSKMIFTKPVKNSESMSSDDKRPKKKIAIIGAGPIGPTALGKAVATKLAEDDVPIVHVPEPSEERGVNPETSPGLGPGPRALHGRMGSLLSAMMLINPMAMMYEPNYDDIDRSMLIDGRKNHSPKPRHSAIKISPRTEAKIGRNEPCPCGSGMKFKKCCINADKMEDVYQKWIIVDRTEDTNDHDTDNPDYELRLGRVGEHVELMPKGCDEDRVLGGGWWICNNRDKKLFLYSSSEKFGQCTIEQVTRVMHLGTGRGFDSYKWLYSEGESASGEFEVIPKMSIQDEGEYKIKLACVKEIVDREGLSLEDERKLDLFAAEVDQWETFHYPLGVPDSEVDQK